MLVLTRTEGEEIVIDGKIVVTVVRVQGNQIRLGIDAPKDVSIRRSELKSLGGGLPASLATSAV